MRDRLGDEFALLVLATGTTVQNRDQREGRLLQPLAQHPGKQVVVAILLPVVIKGDQEYIGLLQEVQHGLAAVLCPHGIAERGAEAL